MADGFAIYSDVATRYVKVFEVQKEHSISGCPLQAHTRGNLRPDWRWATQCFPVVAKEQGSDTGRETGPRSQPQRTDSSGLMRQRRGEPEPSFAAIGLVQELQRMTTPRRRG